MGGRVAPGGSKSGELEGAEGEGASFTCLFISFALKVAVMVAYCLLLAATFPLTLLCAHGLVVSLLFVIVATVAVVAPLSLFPDLPIPQLYTHAAYIYNEFRFGCIADTHYTYIYATRICSSQHLVYFCACSVGRADGWLGILDPTMCWSLSCPLGSSSVDISPNRPTNRQSANTRI